MTVEHIAWVLNVSEAKGTERLVLIGLANHADEDGEAFPAISTLAQYAAVSESSARRALQRLEADGRVKIELNAGGTRKTRGNRRPNRYTMLHDGEPVTLGVAQTRPLDESQGSRLDDLGVAITTFRGRAAVTPKPLLEPSEEPSVSAAADAAASSKRSSKKPEAPERLKAREIVNAWWEWHGANNAGRPPTATPYMGVVKNVERLVIAGYTDPEIKRALRLAPNVSVNWLEGHIKQERANPRSVERTPEEVAEEDPRPDWRNVRALAEWESRQAAKKAADG